MRSVFVENPIQENNCISLKTKDYHHLVNVIRLKTGERVNLFNREQTVFTTEVATISKKEIVFSIIESFQAKSSLIGITVAFGKLKKEAFDLSVKQLVEIGIKEILIFESEYSQNYSLKMERLDKIIISAMEQSNNYIFPQIRECKFIDMLKSNKNIIYFSSNPKNHQKFDTFYPDSLVIIGPEGGLSLKEESELINGGANTHHLPTKIMRAQTAVSFCSGFVLGLLER